MDAHGGSDHRVASETLCHSQEQGADQRAFLWQESRSSGDPSIQTLIAPSTPASPWSEPEDLLIMPLKIFFLLPIFSVTDQAWSYG